LAATYEVLDIAGRPAVLQEFINGLPSGDWPAMAGSPGVWCRLATQAAMGLQLAHQIGLAHGRLRPASVVLTPEGQVKLVGLGEPPWISSTRLSSGTAADPTPKDDLRAFGQVALDW